MTTPSLQDSIVRAQQGDGAALAEVIGSIRQRVERQLKRYPFTVEDQTDALQNTLLRVVTRINEYRGEAKFSTWVFRVTANEALMMMRVERRHRSRRADIDPADIGLSAGDAERGPASVDSADVTGLRLAVASPSPAWCSVDEARVRAAMARLPDHYRDVLLAHYHEGYKLQEIAAMLATSESSVRSRLHRARRELRRSLGAEPESGDARARAA